MKKATVVIPNYNGINYIGECLESLSALEEQELFETVVVDNGSEDGSLALVREKYPQVRIRAFSENTGFCLAVNAGISEAHTPYVILLNNDTAVLPGFVKSLVEALEQDGRIFAASAMMLKWGPDGKTSGLIDDAGDQYCALGFAYARGKGEPACRFEKPVRVFAACGGASIYRKSVLGEIGGFDENHFAYLEDVDICFRAAVYGYRCVYAPRARVLHAGSATSGSRYNEFKVALSSENSVYLAVKNMPYGMLLWNLPFLLPGFFVKFLFFCAKGMGWVYLRGLGRGVKKSFRAEGRRHKVPFRWRNFGRYLKIQGRLYRNMAGLFLKR